MHYNAFRMKHLFWTNTGEILPGDSTFIIITIIISLLMTEREMNLKEF